MIPIAINSMRCPTASCGGESRRAGAHVHRNRQRRQDLQTRRLSRKICGPRVAQQRLPLRRQAIQQRQHAEAPKAVDEQRRRLVHGSLLRARANKDSSPRATKNAYIAKMQAAPTAALLDPSGEIGHLYDAKTSPQMVVINPQGVVIYDGAIDDSPPPISRTSPARQTTSRSLSSNPWRANQSPHPQRVPTAAQ